MKSSLESISNLERKLNIEVPSEEVQVAFENALKGVQRTVAVKGFRKGKAPLQTIRSIYGDRIRQDVIQDIIQLNFFMAVKEHSLFPITAPAIEFDPLTDGQAFAFSAEFEIRPEVQDVKIDGLKVKKEKLEISDKTMSDTLDEIRKARAETVPVLEDRPAQLSDTAVIDFKGFIDGKELENGAGEDHSLELGSNSFIPGFEEKIVGMRVGVENTINLNFPAEYHVKELAGKAVEFKVKLKALSKKSLPELNDEFAKTLGTYENLDALKKAVHEDFEKREGKRVNDDMKNRMMRVLVDRNPVPVPKSMMIEQKKALLDDLERRMAQQGLSPDQVEDYKTKWDSDFEKTASYMIQSSFLVDKLATEHSLRATSNDIDSKLKTYAAESGIDFQRLIEFYSDKEQKSRLTYQITEEKVLDFLVSKAKIEEVPKDQIETEKN